MQPPKMLRGKLLSAIKPLSFERCIFYLYTLPLRFQEQTVMINSTFLSFPCEDRATDLVMQALTTCYRSEAFKRTKENPLTNIKSSLWIGYRHRHRPAVTPLHQTLNPCPQLMPPRIFCFLLLLQNNFEFQSDPAWRRMGLAEYLAAAAPTAW